MYDVMLGFIFFYIIIIIIVILPLIDLEIETYIPKCVQIISSCSRGLAIFRNKTLALKLFGTERFLPCHRLLQRLAKIVPRLLKRYV